jgi:uncharacterized tellurite resistance protein B-like protein
MFERLLTFLKDLPGRDGGGGQEDERDDPRVAVAALMFHVIDADGVRESAERARLNEELSRTYAITGAELERVTAAGEAAEREAVDLYAFTSILNRRLEHAERVELVRILWEMVYADGELHELEDSIVRRVAELLGVEAGDRVALRRQVERRTSPDEEDD